MASKPSRTARSAAWRERGDDALQALGVERLGHVPPVRERHGGGSDRGPGVLAARQRLAALERRLAGGLAAGVGELDRKARAGGRNAPRRIEHARERRLVGVRVEAETAVRDAARPLHRGGFHHHHAGAADGELHQVLQMPVRRAAVARRVLAHGRHGDAVGELDGSERKGREEVGHGVTLVVGAEEGECRQIAEARPLVATEKGPAVYRRIAGTVARHVC